MNIKLEINNQTNYNVSEKALNILIGNVILGSKYDFLEGKNVEISLAFISEDEIKRLNNDYRGINKVTDVLSFSNYENVDEIKEEALGDVYLGEILVCCEDVEKYAKIISSSFEKELAYVVSHGMLHLLGFSHGEEMFLLQKKISDDFLNNENKLLK